MMKPEQKKAYNFNLEHIKAAGLPYTETSPTVCVFPVNVNDKSAKAVYYTSTGLFIVAQAQVNEYMDVVKALQWIHKHQ